jgi:uncharacterized membrane protein
MTWARGVLALCILGLALTAPAPALGAATAAELTRMKAGELLIEDVEVPEGGAVEARLFVAAPPALAKAVMWRHEDYPAWMPKCKWVKVHERRGNVHVVEMAGGQGPVTVTYTMERKLEPTGISWKTLKGDVKRNDGFWIFEPAPGGTLLTYHVHVVPHGPVPGKVVAFLQKQALPDMLKAVRQRIESEARR